MPRMPGALALVLLCSACDSREIVQSPAETGLSSTIPTSALVCPEGSHLLAEQRLCVTEEHAIGPFSPNMIAACRAEASEEMCQGPLWPLELARRLRGTEPCMPGTEHDEATGACISGNDAYGPFTAATLQNCRAYGGGKACNWMRIARPMVIPYSGTIVVVGDSSLSGATGRSLFQALEASGHKGKVYLYAVCGSGVAHWSGTGDNTYRACGAQALEPLRVFGETTPRITTMVERLKPSAVILSLGTNDYGRSNEDIANRYGSFFREIQSAGGATLAECHLFGPWSIERANVRGRLDGVYEGLRRAAAGTPCQIHDSRPIASSAGSPDRLHIPVGSSSERRFVDALSRSVH